MLQIINNFAIQKLLEKYSYFIAVIESKERLKNWRKEFLKVFL
jgi:hypothetical protein